MSDKILIVSDVHTNKQAVINLIKKYKPKVVACSGDVNNDKVFIKKYITYFAPGDSEITANSSFKKSANSDEDSKKIYQLFLKKAKYFRFGGKNFMLTHYFDIKNPIKTLAKEYKAEIKKHKVNYVISGHTHIPSIIHYFYGFIGLNPGSLDKGRDVKMGRTFILGKKSKNGIKFKIIKYKKH
jgi:predicted phosphodiesterase